MSSPKSKRVTYRESHNIPSDAPKYAYRNGKKVPSKEERIEVNRQKARLNYWIKKGMPYPEDKEHREGRWRLTKESLDKRISEYRSSYQKTRRTELPSYTFGILKTNAKLRGLEVSITLDEFRELRKLRCNYCDENLPKHGSGLDRLDNSKGYTVDNVVPCCGRCNKTRSNNLSPEEMKLIVEFRKSKT